MLSSSACRSRAFESFYLAADTLPPPLVFLSSIAETIRICRLIINKNEENERNSPIFRRGKGDNARRTLMGKEKEQR